MTIKKKINWIVFFLDAAIMGLIVFFIFDRVLIKENPLIALFTITPLLAVHVILTLVKNKIIKRLSNIREVIDAVGTGKLDYKFDSKKRDEIGLIIEALNKTSGKIKDSYLGIEKRVAERTKELTVKTEKIRHQSAEYESLLSNIAEGIVAVDNECRVIFSNKEADKMLGFAPGELLGKIFVEAVETQDESGTMIARKDRPLVRALEGITTKISLSAPFYFVTKDNRRFPADISSSPITMKEKIIGGIMVFKDITKDIEVDRAKTEFVSLASHELRTPPTAVKWYTESLLSHPANFDEKQIKYLKEIYKSNKRMIYLVNSLLNVSRIELGTFIVDTEPANFAEGVEVILNELKTQIREKKLTIEQIYEKNMPPIQADPKLLVIIFQNLITNAIKYTPEGGKITIEIKTRDGNILLRVSDNGGGIPEHQQQKIFTKLFRADNANDYDPDGSGLGLYITKSIVEQTGGKIWFDSAEKKGTDFYVSFPLEGMKAKKGNRMLT